MDSKVSLGTKSFISLTEKLGFHLEQKLLELSRAKFSPEVLDAQLVPSLWEDFPRRSSFYVAAIREWISGTVSVQQEVAESISMWGRWPFSIREKFGSVRIYESGLETLCEMVWSKCAADILLHIMRYTEYSRDPTGVYELAIKHLYNLDQVADKVGKADLTCRVAAQAMFQWATIVGEICKRNHAVVSRMLCDEVNFLAWKFVDLSVSSGHIVREVLSKLAERLSQPKIEKAERLVRIQTMDYILERIDFRKRAKGLKQDKNKDKQDKDDVWEQVFKTVVVAKIYKAAEQFAKTDELKAASLSLMQTIIIHSPKSYYDSNFSNFFSKRVVRHLTEPRKVSHSLEIILRSLRNPEYKRPSLAWDAFEQYCPKVRYQFHTSPLSKPSSQPAKTLELVFTEIFEKPKSKALASFGGSLHHGNASASTSVDANFINPHTINAVAAAAAASSSLGPSSSNTGSSNASSIDPSSTGVSGLSSAVQASMGQTALRGQLPLPKHLRACKHILLQIAAHDIGFFTSRALPSLLHLPEELLKCSVIAANRAVVTFRTLWDMLHPGYSAFRSTAYSLQDVNVRKNALDNILLSLRRTLPKMLVALEKVAGPQAIGKAEFALAPTILWDTARTPLGDASVPNDPVGDSLGYPFAWSDPDRNELEAFVFTNDGFVLELHHLSVLHDMFDTGGATAFRSRNEKDKRSAELQLQHWLRVRQAVLKKKSSNGTLNVLRELLYAYPLLTCSPALSRDALDPKTIMDLIPPANLLSHADWTIATATSHAYQRIISCAVSNLARYAVVDRLVKAISGACGPSHTSIRTLLTLLRQLLLLLRLWIFNRSTAAREAGVVPENLDADKVQPVLITSIALLAIPCTTVRLHAVELLDCTRKLWHQVNASETILSILENRDFGRYACILGEECFCSSAPVFRRRTVEDARPQAVNSLRMEKHSSLPLTRTFSYSDAAMSNVTPSARGSSASFENTFHYVSGKSHSRDDLFLWYQSPSSVLAYPSVLGPSQVSSSLLQASSGEFSPRSSSRSRLGFAGGSAPPLDALGNSQNNNKKANSPTSPKTRHGSLIASLSPKSRSNVPLMQEPKRTHDNAGGDNQWRLEVIRIAHRFVDCASLHSLLYKTNQVLLMWLEKLPSFSEELSDYQSSLRTTACCFALALAGCNPDALTTSPHSIPPTHHKWPGMLEKSIEALVFSLWDQAEKITPTSQERVLQLESLQELVGWSSHQNCLGRFVVLLKEWRNQRLKALATKGNTPRGQVTDSSSKFNLFSRSRSITSNSTTNGSSGHGNGNSSGTDGTGLTSTNSFSFGDTSFRSVQKLRLHVESIAASVVRLLLGSQNKGGIPGWEFALKSCFGLLSDMVETEAVQEWDVNFAMEFSKLVLQCSRSVSGELGFLEDMGSVVSRADGVWPRAERRTIWKLLQRLAGYDDLPVFVVKSSTSTSPLMPNSASSSSITSSSSGAAALTSSASMPSASTNSSATASLSQPLGNTSGPPRVPSSRMIGQQEQKFVVESDFKRLRDLVTRTAAAMLRLGPTSLGTVAPRPDEMLWAWLYYDEYRGGLAPEGRLLSNYLIAHWRVGDLECAGGGTFSPFLDRWYEEITKRKTENADAIFCSIFDAVRIWLFRGLRLHFERPLEMSAVPSVSLLALIQVRTHSNPDIRAKAFQLLDVIERSIGSSSAHNCDFHQGSALSSLASSSHLETIRRTAIRTSILFAESCPLLAPSLISELCARLPALVYGGLARDTIEVIVPWFKSSATQVSPLDINLSRDEENSLNKDDRRTSDGGDSLATGDLSLLSPSRLNSDDRDNEDLPAPPSSPSSVQSSFRRSSRPVTSKEMTVKLKTHVSLPELWECCDTLYHLDGEQGLDLILPGWRAMCSHHPSLVLDFVLSKLICFDIIPHNNSRAIASFLLAGMILDVFEPTPGIILQQVVVNVMYSFNLMDVSRSLFRKHRSSLRADKPVILQNWVASALSHTPATHVLHNEQELIAAGNLEQLLELQRSSLHALNVCAGSNRGVFASAFPIMATFSLSASSVSRSRSGVSPRKVLPSTAPLMNLWYSLEKELTSPEHHCIALMLRAIVHERSLHRDPSRDSRRISSLSADSSVSGDIGQNISLLGHLPDITLLELASIPPSQYSDEQLKHVVESLLELLILCDPSGKLVNTWCQCVLLASISEFHPQMTSFPEVLTRCLKVYQYLRPCVPGALCVVWRHRELTEEDAFRLEYLALTRILIGAIYNSVPQVAKMAALCMIQLDLRHVSVEVTSSLLCVYATMESGSDVERMVLNVLLGLPVKNINVALSCSKSLVEKLQCAVVQSFLSIEDTVNTWKPASELMLFQQYVASPKRPGFPTFFVSLFTFLLMHDFQAEDSVIDALLALDMPTSLQDAVTAFCGCTDNAKLLDDVWFLACKSFGLEEVARVLTDLLLEYDEHYSFVAAIFKSCSSCLSVFPKRIGCFVKIVDYALSTEVNRSFSSLVRAREFLLQTFHKLSLGSSWRSEAEEVKESMSEDVEPGLTKTHKEIDEFLAEETRQIEDSISDELSTVSPTGSLASPLGVASLGGNDVGSFGGFGSPKFFSPFPASSSEAGPMMSPLSTLGGSTKSLVTDLSEKNVSSASAGSDNATSMMLLCGRTECVVGGVGSFDNAKFSRADHADRVDEEITSSEGLNSATNNSNSNSTVQPHLHQGLVILEARSFREPARGVSRVLPRVFRSEDVPLADPMIFSESAFMDFFLANQHVKSRVDLFLSEEPAIERTWVDFAFAVAEFKVAPREENVQEIYERFIQLDAIDTLDLSSETRATLLDRLSEWQAPDATVFDIALVECMLYLEEENFFGRCLRSTHFCNA